MKNQNTVKKLLAMLLALTMLFALAACGSPAAQNSQTSQSGESTPPASEPVTEPSDAPSEEPSAEPTPVIYVITYMSGDGQGDPIPVQVPGESPMIKLNDCAFVAPEGQTFVGWEIAGAVYPAQSDFIMTGSVDAVAKYAVSDTADDPSVTEPKSAGIQSTEPLNWKIQGENNVTVSFANAKVSSVKIAGNGTDTVLTNGGQYITLDEGRTVVFNAGLEAFGPGAYLLTFDFEPDTDGGIYTEENLSLNVVSAEAQQAQEEVKNWTNRNVEWEVPFDKTPQSLDVNYNTADPANPDWRARRLNEEYRLYGNSVIFMPGMVNKGSTVADWGNGRYQFRVTFTDGSSEVFYVLVEGTLPTYTPTPQPTATPTPTPAPTQPPVAGAPATGDSTPIATYVIVLVVLLVVLVAVVIIIVKQKKRK